MTQRAPERLAPTMWVTGVGTDAAAALADAGRAGTAPAIEIWNLVESLAEGKLPTAMLASNGKSSALVLLEPADEARARGVKPYAVVAGKATTGLGSLGRADATDLEPARAIRRALAEGKLKAADVGLVCVMASDLGSGRVEHAVERGLGRWSADVAVETGGPGLVRCVLAVALAHPGGHDRIAGAEPGVRAIAERVRSALRTPTRPGAVLLMLEPGGRNSALAFSTPR